MGLQQPKPGSTPPLPPAWQLGCSAASGQRRLLPLARRGLSHAENTGLLLCSSPGSDGGQRKGCHTRCCETREGPLQLSSSGAAQGPT